MTEQQDCEPLLINDTQFGSQHHEEQPAALSLPSIQVNDATLLDIQLLHDGTYAPLTGFVTREEWAHVVEEMRLPNGQVWPIPITLPISEAEAMALSEGQDIWLCAEGGRVQAQLHITDVFPCDKLREAERVFRTADENHPGVKQLYEREEYCVSGPITVIEGPATRLCAYAPTPNQVRSLFRKRGWRTVVGMLVHECCIEQVESTTATFFAQSVDGLLIHVVADSDHATDAMAASCEVVEASFRAHKVYNTVVLPYPAPVRYAGARERLMQALIQRNLGCTHFVAARMGCGDNGSDVQLLWRQFDLPYLGITPIFG